MIPAAVCAQVDAANYSEARNTMTKRVYVVHSHVKYGYRRASFLAGTAWHPSRAHLQQSHICCPALLPWLGPGMLLQHAQYLKASSLTMPSIASAAVQCAFCTSPWQHRVACLTSAHATQNPNLE